MINDRYLFRGKHIKTGDWVQGYYCFVPAAYWYAYSREACDRHVIKHAVFDGGKSIRYEDVDPATIGQCTGLRDKNGTLIFEGDIISCRNDLVFIGSVEWAHDLWVVRMFDESRVPIHTLFGVLCCSAMEVIGNIHDNQDSDKTIERTDKS